MPYVIYETPQTAGDPAEIDFVVNSEDATLAADQAGAGQSYVHTTIEDVTPDDYYVKNGSVKQRSENRTYILSITSDYTESTKTSVNGVTVHYVSDWDGVKFTAQGDETVTIENDDGSDPKSFSPGSEDVIIKFSEPGIFNITISPPFPEPERVFRVTVDFSEGRFDTSNQMILTHDLVELDT